MKSEIRNCQNCHKDFTIEPEDFNFYTKIKVSPPTFCPECRTIRRMVWRNERNLYKRKNNAPDRNEEILSMYAPDSPYTIYDKEYWWGGGWDPYAYGRDYDFSKTFFEQYDDLLKSVPLQALQLMNSTNSQYCNYIDNNKNCYLAFGSGWSENSRYLNRSSHARDCQDLLTSYHNELCFDLIDCYNSFKLISSENCSNCVDSFFLYNCRNCTDCFGCANLTNKSYCLFNKQLTREEYQEKIKDLNLGNKENFQKYKEKFEQEIKSKAVRRFANVFQSINCKGDNILKSKNCYQCFDTYGDSENCAYLIHCLKDKDNYDSYGNFDDELCYECVDNDVGMSNISTITVYSSNNCHYCFTCQSSSNLFGCVGIQSGEYVILNKKYSKEDYLVLRSKIIEQMMNMPYKGKNGRSYVYGDFFPFEISPWAYNETIANEYYPITKEQAGELEYRWREKEKRNYQIDLSYADIPDDIKNAPEEILGKVLECEHFGRRDHKPKCDTVCTEAFRLTPDEFSFYNKMNLPLPTLCPTCRHYERLSKRNPFKLWHRKCMKDGCNNEFETSYAPERPEIVYCEKCYQQEVY
jgi:hypothetical protein